MEEALHDSKAMRRFAGIDLGQEPAPDETTICQCRHLLEACGLGEAIFQKVREPLKAHGLRVSGGTIVDATMINAPSSTQNRDRSRDPREAPEEKRQPGVLWDESPYRSGGRNQADLLGGDHLGEGAWTRRGSRRRCAGRKGEWGGFGLLGTVRSDP